MISRPGRLLAIVAFAAGLLWVVVASGLARAAQSGAQDAALALWPWNAAASAQGGLAAVLQPRPATVRGRTLAVRALTLDASQALAYGVLGSIADSRNDPPAARRLFAASSRLSRRILLVQLWLNEDAVRRGSVAEALEHYDIALRTSPDAQQILFPVLTAAAGDPNITLPLAGKLRSAPVWRDAFMRYASAHGDPTAIAALFASDSGLLGAAPFDARLQLVQRLVAAGRISSAYRLAGGKTVERTVSLEGSPAQVPPFAWSAFPSDAIDASLDGRSHQIDAATHATGAQLAAGRIAALGAGRYALDLAGTVRAGQGEAHWTVRCIDGRTLTVAALSSAPAAHGLFIVPAGCPFQWLRLELASSPDSADYGVIVTGLRIAPVPASGKE